MRSPGPPTFDPMPEPPPRPDLDECCASGCDPCIFDLYDRALEQYQRALREWQGRHPEKTTAVD